MSLEKSGLDAKLKSERVELLIFEDHPLIKLANGLDWDQLYGVTEHDLKRGIHWILGRKLKLRIHLAVFLLQTLKQFTDRQMEEELRYNAAYQVFCGWSVVDNWHCPDHTKIERFRNRLSPETQHTLVNAILKIAERHGFADPSRMDVDSTVQEANISYPSDARLLVKLAEKGLRVVEGLQHWGYQAVENLKINIKEIKAKAKTYFFLKKNTKIDQRREVFKRLYDEVKDQVLEVLEYLEPLPQKTFDSLKWNLKKVIQALKNQAHEYLEAVLYFIENHTVKEGKLLAFHAKAVVCIRKGKAGKANEFGRVFQLGRLGGNFMMVKRATTLREEDKTMIKPFIKEHQKLFGKKTLKSAGTDKGYFSAKAVKDLKTEIKELYIQQPANMKKDWSGLDEASKERLRNRRAGIEPLIGHLKNKFGLRKSRMKSDETTLASAYRSVLGFNLHQLIRHQQGLYSKVATPG